MACCQAWLLGQRWHSLGADSGLAARSAPTQSSCLISFIGLSDPIAVSMFMARASQSSHMDHGVVVEDGLVTSHREHGGHETFDLSSIEIVAPDEACAMMHGTISNNAPDDR